jgi:hypothetical protein
MLDATVQKVDQAIDIPPDLAKPGAVVVHSGQVGVVVKDDAGLKLVTAGRALFRKGRGAFTPGDECRYSMTNREIVTERGHRPGRPVEDEKPIDNGEVIVIGTASNRAGREDGIVLVKLAGKAVKAGKKKPAAGTDDKADARTNAGG